MAYTITVSRSQKRLILFRNGLVVKSYPVGIGKMLTPTPRGTYRIMSKVPNPGGFFGAMWLGLSKPHYGIHGTNNTVSIGKEVSHGCIRMFNRDVIQLSRIVPIGTPVTILR